MKRGLGQCIFMGPLTLLIFLGACRKEERVSSVQSPEALPAVASNAGVPMVSAATGGPTDEERLRDLTALEKRIGSKELDDVDAVRELVNYIQSADSLVRAKALKDLAKNGANTCTKMQLPEHYMILNERMSSEAIPVITRIAQNDESSLVRMEAVTVLGNFACNNSAASLSLKTALNDPDSDVRRRTAFALLRAGIFTREETDAVLAKSPEFGDVSTSDLIRRLPDLARSDSNNYAIAVADRGLQAVPDLCALLTNGGSEVQYENARSILARISIAHSGDPFFEQWKPCMHLVESRTSWRQKHPENPASQSK